MTRRPLPHRKLTSALAIFLSLALPIMADDKPIADDSSAGRPAAAASASSSDIEQLKKMLLDQQRQIDELRRALAAKSEAPEKSGKKDETSVIAYPKTGEVASTTPIVPSAPLPVAPPVFNTATPTPVPVPPAPQPESASPLQLKLGEAYFTPVGFMDMTSVTRSTNAGSGIGTNFGGIPYNNTQAGSLTETRMSPQNSRIGMRVDALVRGMKVMGYWESDFLGQTGNPPNGGIAVSSNPYVFRLRLYWVDVRTGKFEILGGQTWSLMTPNRYSLSPLPGDVFYSQDMDVNYQAGLVWGRIPEFRFVYHPSDKVAFGVALSNSEPYVGGANGGSVIAPPSALSGLLGGQVNNGTSVISSAALAPDIIAKLAFDPSRKFHLEIAGVEIANKISNPTTSPAFQTFSKVGGGGSVNLNFDLVKNVRLLTNNYWSDGGGRYIFGEAPDFIIRSNGSLSNGSLRFHCERL